MFSSIAMSLNSLESKTSPHSWHSTNSASSSRATTRTRGCLQSFSISVVSEGRFEIGEIWTEFIFGFRRLSYLCLSRIAGILCPLGGLSSVLPHPRRRLLPYRFQWMRILIAGLLKFLWQGVDAGFTRVLN